ncbi:peptide deformylase [Streptomyces hundungensis]|uniref:peptide deformylase n=1 Tax=Streptomyces hundungensis TaxID=1077946 RepID=UPI0034035508
MATKPPTDRRVRVQGVPVDGAYPERAPEAARGQVLRVTVVGEDILHRPCTAATTEFGTPWLSRLIDDMFVTMYVAEGAGLAANQVDVDLRLFVYDCYDDDGVRHVGHVLNPVVDPAAPDGRRLLDAEEGCLSVPGPRVGVHREETAVVRGLDKEGNEVVIEGSGYFARCLLHETDHLNGLLYTDRLTKRQRRSALREMDDLIEGVFARRVERARSIGAVHRAGPEQPPRPASPLAVRTRDGAP